MNKNLAGGYYIVSLGDVDLLGESVSLAGVAKLLYEAKKHKFVVLQGIVMDGEKKTAIPVAFEATMALTTEPDDWDESEDGEFVAEEVYTATIYNVYGKNIAIDAEGDATITDYIEGFDPSSVEAGDILQNAVLGLDSDGELVKGDLFGKYVRIIKASEIDVNALTDEIIEILRNGCFVEGDLLNIHNPAFMPSQYVIADGGYRAFVWGSSATSADCGLYELHINVNERKLKYIQSILLADYAGYNLITFKANYFNGKQIPSYPSSTGRFHFVSNNGNLAWIKGLYLHTITFNVSGGTTFVIRIVSDSDTACALDSVSGNFVIAGATCLIPSNMGNAVLTPFDANGFNPDIHLFDSATGAYSTAVTLASVESDTITPIG